MGSKINFFQCKITSFLVGSKLVEELVGVETEVKVEVEVEVDCDKEAELVCLLVCRV